MRKGTFTMQRARMHSLEEHYRKMDSEVISEPLVESIAAPISFMAKPIESDRAHVAIVSEVARGRFSLSSITEGVEVQKVRVGNMWQPCAYVFDSTIWNEVTSKKWLEENKISYFSFKPAKTEMGGSFLNEESEYLKKVNEIKAKYKDALDEIDSDMKDDIETEEVSQATKDNYSDRWYVIPEIKKKYAVKKEKIIQDRNKELEALRAKKNESLNEEEKNPRIIELKRKIKEKQEELDKHDEVAEKKNEESSRRWPDSKIRDIDKARKKDPALDAWIKEADAFDKEREKIDKDLYALKQELNKLEGKNESLNEDRLEEAILPTEFWTWAEKYIRNIRAEHTTPEEAKNEAESLQTQVGEKAQEMLPGKVDTPENVEKFIGLLNKVSESINEDEYGVGTIVPVNLKDMGAEFGQEVSLPPTPFPSAAEDDALYTKVYHAVSISKKALVDALNLNQLSSFQITLSVLASAAAVFLLGRYLGLTIIPRIIGWGYKKLNIKSFTPGDVLQYCITNGIGQLEQAYVVALESGKQYRFNKDVSLVYVNMWLKSPKEVVAKPNDMFTFQGFGTIRWWKTGKPAAIVVFSTTEFKNRQSFVAIEDLIHIVNIDGTPLVHVQTESVGLKKKESPINKKKNESLEEAKYPDSFWVEFEAFVSNIKNSTLSKEEVISGMQKNFSKITSAVQEYSEKPDEEDIQKAKEIITRIMESTNSTKHNLDEFENVEQMYEYTVQLLKFSYVGILKGWDAYMQFMTTPLKKEVLGGLVSIPTGGKAIATPFMAKAMAVLIALSVQIEGIIVWNSGWPKLCSGFNWLKKALTTKTYSVGDVKEWLEKSGYNDSVVAGIVKLKQNEVYRFSQDVVLAYANRVFKSAQVVHPKDVFTFQGFARPRFFGDGEPCLMIAFHIGDLKDKECFAPLSSLKFLLDVEGNKVLSSERTPEVKTESKLNEIFGLSEKEKKKEEYEMKKTDLEIKFVSEASRIRKTYDNPERDEKLVVLKARKTKELEALKTQYAQWLG